MSEDSLKLINALKSIFSEIGDLTEQLDSDSEALNEVMDGTSEAKEIIDEIEAIKSDGQALRADPSSDKVDSLIARITVLSARMKALPAVDSTVKEMLRIILCNVGIETVVALHNEKEETEFALRINSALATAFSDISTLGEKLESECSILNKQLMVKNLLKQYQGGTRSSTGSGTTSNQPSRASGTGRTSYGTTGYSGTKKQSSHLTGNSGGGVAGVSHNSFSNQASRGGTSSAVKRTVTDNRPKRPFSGKRFAATIVIALIIFCIIASLIDSPSSKTTSSSSCSSGVTVSTPAPKPTPKPTHAYIHTHACTCSQIRTGILFRFVAFGRCVC